MHLIFDLDGTLIDSIPDIHTSINLLLEEHSLPTLELEETRSFVGNGSRKLVERAFTKQASSSPDSEQLDLLTNAFINIYMAYLTDQTLLYPNVRESLQRLKQLGHCLHICTNKPFKPTLEILKELHLLPLFEMVIGGDSYPERKPHPRQILEILAAQKIQASDAIMIGDSIYDIEAGNAAKVSTVLIGHGYDYSEGTAKQCDFKIDDMVELEGLILKLEV